MTYSEQTLRERMATALRLLSVDMIEQARSGHPGAPLGLADVMTVLWREYLRFDASAPNWYDRDRLVLSGGHASALLYALLYLTGYTAATLDELRRFRQLGSKTAGHPERGLMPGVDYTTGPLGQGLAGAVGMALAERMMNARFGDALVNHYTYVTCGDGDLMEGISEEALSLAGHWRLNRLIVMWDDNRITIDGTTDLATDTNMKKRFEANGWRVLTCDGHDYESVSRALAKAHQSDRPVMIDCKTVIGYGAPTKSGTPKCHGSPLGPEEVAGLRRNLNWPYEPFDIPEDILEAWRAVGAQGEGDRKQWEMRVAHDANREIFLAMIQGELPGDLSETLMRVKKQIITEAPTVATRKSSQRVLTALAESLPNLIGGSADLSAACFTDTPQSVAITRLDYSGNYLNYGVREMGMAGIMDGLAAHGGFIPYAGTFLSFLDYMKPGVRLAALMGLRVVFVYTHDSIGVGEDGPTHQPIAQLANMRATPNLYVFRPADGVETAECYELALRRTAGPSAMVLSRQGLPTVRTTADENLSARGGYILAPADGACQITLIATGSEVALALQARDMLQAQGVGTTVVSLPCVELFEAQDSAYQSQVLGTAPRLVIEAAATWGWERFVGSSGGAVIGIDTFGASGKGPDVMAHFGFTPENVVARALQLIP